MLYAKDIKNLKEAAGRSGNGIELYYNIKTNSVTTRQWSGTHAYGDDWYVCTFMRENTEDEIVAAVNRMLCM